MSAGRAEALGAIVLWGALAALALELAAVPPFLLTGLALAIGALVGGRALAHPPPPPAALALGVYGLFGFHFAFEPRYWPREAEWLYLIALGLGPMGAAFFLWDRALKDATSLVAMALILVGAWLGR